MTLGTLGGLPAIGLAGDAHTEFTLDTADVATGGREGFWAVRNGDTDWYAFYGDNTSTPRDLLRVTSSDGVSWSSETVVIDGSAQFSAEDIGMLKKGDGTWVLFAEDDANNVQRIYTASDISATSWTHEGIISATSGDQVSNFIPFEDGGQWYALHEERDLDGPEHIRLIENTADPATPADWTDVGRVTLDGSAQSNYAPFSVYQWAGENRCLVKDLDADVWEAIRPTASDYTAFETVGGVSAPSAGSREPDAVAHDSDGWSEYYPEGDETPWLYSWYSANQGGDDNFDLLKG